MLKQVSIYAENKKGTIQNITGLLAEKNINILGSVINDGAEYGIIRMVVSDPETAAETLTKAGYLCKLIDVLGVEVEDKVGNLHELLKALYESNVNATYIYLSFNRESGKPIMVFHTEDITEVEFLPQSNMPAYPGNQLRHDHPTHTHTWTTEDSHIIP